MAIILHYMMFSPPARSVMLTLKALGIPYELKKINLFKGEHCSEEYLKLNPQHTIPTIQDNGFAIWDSHAINAYLVTKYGKDDKLYPKEPKARAIVDQRLHFDTGVLYASLRNITVGVFLKKKISRMTDELTATIEEAYDFTEKFLQGREYIAGNNITIADFSVASNLANGIIFAPINKDKYLLLTQYLKRCEANIPGFKELNEEGIQSFRELLKKHNFELPSP